MSKQSAPLTLFLFLFSLYLLTYSPTLHSSDGLAMFSTTESLIRRGAWDIEQIRWMGLQQGTYGLDGLLYSRKGVGQPLLALPLTWLGLVIPWFGTVTVTMLFGSFTTALTGTLIFIYLRTLGHSEKAGLIAGLVYGTGTTAWPYAKTFFSDTLAGLLLLITALTLLTYRQKRQNRYAFAAGLALAWAVATRYAEAVFLPVFGLLFLAYLFEDREGGGQGERERGRPFAQKAPYPPAALFSFAAPILVIGVLLLIFNTVRYGNPLNTGYLPQETFSAVWWQGISGQLISPGRGLLLYSPVLLATFFGLKPFWQRHRLETLVSLAVILIHLLLYGKWFMWHGGFAWGPRFMVATLPFWIISMAPMIEKLHRRKLVAYNKGLFYFLWAISIILQIPGLAVDFDLWQNRLLETGIPLFDPVTFFNPVYTPLLKTWQFISPANLDVAWVVEGKIIWWLLGALILNVAAAGWALKKLFARSPARKVGGRLNVIFPLALSALSAILLIAHAHQSQPPDLVQAVTAVNRRPNVPLVYRDPQKAIPFAELYAGHAPVLGLREPGLERLDTFQATEVWWLPTYRDEVETALNANYGLAREDRFGEQRLLLFARPDGNSQLQLLKFGEQIALQSVRLSSKLQPNHPLAVELVWQADQTPSADYHVFVHLLNTAGKIIAQSDGQPTGQTRPTTTWQPGETIVDSRALWVADVSPGEYTLIAGLYSSKSGERLPIEGGRDFIELGQFKVNGGQ